METNYIRGEVWAHLYSLTTTLFYVPSQESEFLCICVRVCIFSLSTIFRLEFGTVPTVWYFVFIFHFIVVEDKGINKLLLNLASSSSKNLRLSVFKLDML